MELMESCMLKVFFENNTDYDFVLNGWRKSLCEFEDYGTQ